jgi:hypothetical protein
MHIEETASAIASGMTCQKTSPCSSNTDIVHRSILNLLHVQITRAPRLAHATTRVPRWLHNPLASPEPILGTEGLISSMTEYHW